MTGWVDWDYALNGENSNYILSSIHVIEENFSLLSLFYKILEIQ